ncbi:aldo/keto reductase [Novosphingobium sp. G106]|uniref:aldo/keto reductase n=1 Tax=Novosphingobium sp. G106 TaxID=2849500 RepID=UPI001C2CD76F|nr:aldo/keto reductase [Novosphingobium sp. G106]MBV1691226.1 aldo/keto reductase [Novosphingobium sp. G106]
MEYRLLGRSGLKVSVFSFGAMTFGDGHGMFGNVGDTRGAEAKRQIDTCIDAGVNLFDTADVYTEGQSEEVLGDILGTRRQQVLIATKCYSRQGRGENDLGSSRHHIINACEASLRRLKTDYIDLYQIHNQDLIVPPEETLRALDDLVRQGKVRYVGSSNHSGWTQMRMLATADRMGVTRYISQQIRYSLLDRNAENELMPLGVHEGVGALVWGPLASGYLSGKFRTLTDTSNTRLGQRGTVDAMDNEHTRGVIAAVEGIAQERGVSLSQVALNWVARKAGVATILVGARTMEQLTDNLAAAQWSLSDAEMVRLDEASTKPPIYPYDMHRNFGGDRNPVPGLQPGLPAE